MVLFQSTSNRGAHISQDKLMEIISKMLLELGYEISLEEMKDYIREHTDFNLMT